MSNLRQGLKLAENGLSVEARFRARVDQRGPDECWPWKLTPNGHGYGVFCFDGKRVIASNFALQLKLGRPLRPGYRACHTCDFPLCCNDRHLFEGTQTDNMSDCSSKGRHWTQTHPVEERPWGERNGARTRPERHPRGERHYRSAFDNVEVEAIRQEYAAGGVTYVQLAAKYNSKKTTIGALVRRQNRKRAA